MKQVSPRAIARMFRGGLTVGQLTQFVKGPTEPYKRNAVERILRRQMRKKR